MSFLISLTWNGLFIMLVIVAGFLHDMFIIQLSNLILENVHKSVLGLSLT